MAEIDAPACSLDRRELGEQLARYGRIAAHVQSSRRSPREVTVVLDRDLDDGLLRETLAVESACCPFFTLTWDDRARQLTIAAPAGHEPLLDGVASALRVEPARV